MPRSAALCLALVLLAVPARAADAPADATVDYAKIYLQGDRVLEGIVVKEDEKTITLKTKLATVPVQKDQIVRVVRAGATAAGLAEKDRAKHAYQSLLLGYRIVKPSDWNYKLDPPSPLCDVLIRRYADDMEIGIAGIPDPHPDVELTDAHVEELARMAEAHLLEHFLDVRRESSKRTSFKDRPAIYLEFSVKKKRSLKEYRPAVTIARHAGKVLFLHVWAPRVRFEEAKKAYDEVLASFAPAETRLVDKDRLFEPTHLFSVEKPAEWTFATLPEKGAKAATALLAAPGGGASLRIEASRPGREPDAERWAKNSEAAQLQALEGAKTVSAGPVNVAGRFGHRLVLEGASQGRPVRRAVHFLKDDARGFVVTAEVTADAAAALQPVVDEVLGGFRILNDLLSEGALERGMRAIDACDAGDRKLHAGDANAAMPHFDEAIALVPRFAGAWNNKGVACSDLKDLDGAKRAYQRAQQLFGEDLTIRLNLAACRLWEAMRRVGEEKPAEALALVDEVTALAGTLEEIKPSIAAVLANIGVFYAKKDNFEQAVTLFKRAIPLAPKDADLPKGLSVMLGNAAVTHFNKGNTAKAESLAREALRHDPANASARQVLDAINRR